MSLTLITDRMEDDVRRLAATLAKPYSTWTDAERTWFSGAGEPVRGDYRYTDRNRVGAAVATLQTQLLGGLQELAAYLAAREVAPDELFRLPYEAADVDVSPRTDWTESGIPTRISGRFGGCWPCRALSRRCRIACDTWITPALTPSRRRCWPWRALLPPHWQTARPTRIGRR